MNKNKLKKIARRFILYPGLGLILLVSFAFTHDEYFEISKNIDIFITLFREVNTYYVDETKPGELMKTAIDGMLESLDPYTNYISESEIEDYRFQMTGQYGGIGAQIGIRDGFCIVTEPYEGYAAMKADLRPGDIILEIDGNEMKGKNTADVSKFLKGQAKTKVRLKIKREGEGELTKELEREEIHVKNVPYYGMVDEVTGYIKLRDFRNDAGDEVAKALQELKTKNTQMKQVILDLRGNPGGLLIEAINVVNVFTAKNQLVVKTKGKVKEWEKEYKTQGSPIDVEIPLVVLTNRGSASASEIVSGTIQDLDRGVIVGQRTFGKGLVQSTRPLTYGTQLKVTTAKYYTPTGRCIQALDYSHRNEDGSVGEIADSLKKEFRTLGGRKVFDGGGIAPDIKVDEQKPSNIALSLVNKYIIFDFANKYRREHATIPSAATFKLSEDDWQGFVKLASSKDYEYQTQSEKQLEEFRKKAEQEKYLDQVKTEYEALKKSLQRDKSSDITKQRAELTELIEREIIRRYYFEKGSFEATFEDDPDIKESLKVFADRERFKKLLRP
jgi:carboxyl-terminal processing protease